MVFIYCDIQWGPANIGFSAGNGYNFFMHKSSPSVFTDEDSNAGMAPGLFIYCVDERRILFPPGEISSAVKFEMVMLFLCK